MPRYTVSLSIEIEAADPAAAVGEYIDKAEEGMWVYDVHNWDTGETFTVDRSEGYRVDKVKPERVCVYCGEPIEYRDREWVQKFSNDPQCDDSYNNNHLPRR